jgi:hypothetical protein
VSAFDDILNGAKKGVFISHMTQENPVAEVLKKYLKLAFGPDFRVFVSSDKESIGGGRKWYNHVIDGLRFSKVILVLVSQESKIREWTNFEAGFGEGSECLVIPVTIRNFPLGQLSFPLAGIQGRSIDDIGQIIADIAAYIRITPNGIDELAFAEEKLEAESRLITKNISVQPTWSGQYLSFQLENRGNVDIELLMLEVTIPQSLVSRNWAPVGRGFESRRFTGGNGEQFSWFACFSPRGVYRARESWLRPFLTSSMGTLKVDDFNIPFDLPLTSRQLDISLNYQIHVVGYRTEPEECTVRDIPGIPTV